MSWFGSRKTVLGVVLIGASAFVLSPRSRAQGSPSDSATVIHSADLALVSTIRGLPVGPQGLVRISGTATYEPDGSVFDAATEVSSSGHGAAGLIDPVASGLTLRERHEETHTYVYAAGNPSGARCAAAGLSAPCLVLRLPQIAAARRRDIDELREGMSSTLQLQVLQPSAVATPVPPRPPSPGVHPPQHWTPPPPEGHDNGLFWMGLASASGAAVFSVAFLIFGLRRRRRRRDQGVEGRINASAGRLRKRLAGDPVKARLLQIVNDLSKEASSLTALEARLDKAVEDANPEELERRHRELMERARVLEDKGGEAAGTGEMKDAAAIIEKQIDRCRSWEMQRWRSEARMERIATRLEALEAELNDPSAGTKEPKEELLELLQEELELARAGEREASALLGGGDNNGPSSATTT